MSFLVILTLLTILLTRTLTGTWRLTRLAVSSHCPQSYDCIFTNTCSSKEAMSKPVTKSLMIQPSSALVASSAVKLSTSAEPTTARPSKW